MNRKDTEKDTAKKAQKKTQLQPKSSRSKQTYINIYVCGFVILEYHTSVAFFLYATFGMSIFAAASDGALLDVWLGFPSHGSGRRGSQSESTRWAALDELVSRQPHPRGPLYLRLALLLEHPSRRRTRASDRCVPRDRRAAGAVRRAAAVALIRLSGAAPHARAALPERLQSAISRGERERERERERVLTHPLIPAHFCHSHLPTHTQSSRAPPMHLPCTSRAPPMHLPCTSQAPHLFSSYLTSRTRPCPPSLPLNASSPPGAPRGG